MSELVALDLPGGPDFVDQLRRAWDAGHAVLPVDQRLPAPARKALLSTMRPAHVIDPSGSHRLDNSVPVHSGDALVVATSGSTGNPKGVVLTHAAVEASARASSRALGVTEGDRWLACLPVAHIGGLSVVTRSMVMDIPLTALPHFDAAEVTRLARTCTLVSLVTTTLQRIDPSLFRLILLGGSRPPDRLASNVISTYGSTETGSGIVYDGLPLDGVEIRITDDAEILVRGPMLMRGYRDGTTSIDADGWLHTDDAGTWLEDGRLHVIGRRGDVIVTGGQKVWPEAVERALAGVTTPDDSCIIGLKDDEWGERVVLVTTCRDLVLDDVRDTVRRSLPAYCAPREIRIVDEIPRTALGKIRRTELRSVLSSSN
ncbi:MAG: class I adenylate-forming enzyme family protein [Actinomycetota bacterium]